MTEKEEEEKSLNHPLGGIMRQDLSFGVLRQDLQVPDALKREIPHKDIHAKKQGSDPNYIDCPSCGKRVAGSAPRCAICGSSLEGHEGLRYKAADPKSLIDREWFDGLEDPHSPEMQ